MSPNEASPGSLARTHEDLAGLPRGRTRLPVTTVEMAQRERLLRAVIAAASQHGYAEVTIADVVRRARVSRNSFYHHFADKESCFLAATDLGVELMFARIERAGRELPAGTNAVERLRTGVRAYLGFMTEEPEFARIFLVEALAAGPRLLQRYMAVHQRFAATMRMWHCRARTSMYPNWVPVPEDAYVALVGGLTELVAIHVRLGRTADLPHVEDVLVNLHLAIFSGWQS